MAKESLHLTVDVATKEMLREEGINISKLVNDVLEQIGNEYTDEVALATQIKRLETDTDNLKGEYSRKESYLMYLKDTIVQNEKDIVRLKEELEETKIINKSTRLMRRLNEIIILWRYDEDAIIENGYDIIEQIKSINHSFDLKAHIIKFRDIMKRY